ncbi:MAG TPA: ATP-binding protein [Herpetosiphonaceae bacterium]
MNYLRQQVRRLIFAAGPLGLVRVGAWLALLLWTASAQPHMLLWALLMAALLSGVGLIATRRSGRWPAGSESLGLILTVIMPLLSGGWTSPWVLDGWLALAQQRRHAETGRQRWLLCCVWLTLDGLLAARGGDGWLAAPGPAFHLALHFGLPLLILARPAARPAPAAPPAFDARLAGKLQLLAQRFEHIEAAVGPNSAGREATALLEARLKSAQGLSETRALLAALAPPPPLPDLVSRVQTVAAQRQQQTQLNVSVAAQGVPRGLPQVVEDTLVHVVHEALTNVERHAKATRVDIALRADSEDLVLVVRDNGVGLASGSSDRPGCHGLRALRYRVQELNGLMDVYEGAQGGLVLQVSLPLSVYAL